MAIFIEPIGKLINAFTKLPGVGTKTAQRFAYEVINMSEEEHRAFVMNLCEDPAFRDLLKNSQDSISNISSLNLLLVEFHLM